MKQHTPKILEEMLATFKTSASRTGLVEFKPFTDRRLETQRSTQGPGIVGKEIKRAERFLWNEILRYHRLTMNEGLEDIVYVGGDFAIDAVRYRFGVVETQKGNWATVRIKGTRHSDD